MKKVLLCITTAGTKGTGGKIPELACRRLPLMREIGLAEHAFDPYIDGKRAQALIGKEQDAVGDLGSHARQTAKL